MRSRDELEANLVRSNYDVMLDDLERSLRRMHAIASLAAVLHDDGAPFIADLTPEMQGEVLDQLSLLAGDAVRLADLLSKSTTQD